MRSRALLPVFATLILLGAPQALAQGSVCTDEIARGFEAVEFPDRIPIRIKTCYPMTLIPELGDTPACHTMDMDASACTNEPDDVGCPVTIDIQDVTQLADQSWSILYDADTRGALMDAAGGECEFGATLQGADLQVATMPEPDPPFVRFSVSNVVLPVTMLVPDACAGSADYVTDRISAFIEQELINHVTAEMDAMAAACEPDTNFPDSDGDTVLDCADGCANDPLKSDPGACGCGTVDDADGDGALVCVDDCNDADGSAWAVPDEARDLTLFRQDASGDTELWWNDPANPGADSWTFDVISSTMTSDFSDATCVETGQTDTMTFESSVPAPGTMTVFLIRAANDCPNGTGSSGTDSGGAERAVPVCQ